MAQVHSPEVLNVSWIRFGLLLLPKSHFSSTNEERWVVESVIFVDGAEAGSGGGGGLFDIEVGNLEKRVLAQSVHRCVCS